MIDLNCDLGESFGAWTLGADAEMMDLVSSVNIACGFHAGDASVIGRAVETAIAKNVGIGAHPSYPDLQGFGRREMNLSAGEVYDCVLYQIAALKGICEAHNAKLHHVKPHGALYNVAARKPEIAAAIAAAVYALDRNLILYGLANSFLITEAEKINLRHAAEVFADRTYQPDGSLTPRDQPNALIESTAQAQAQVAEFLQNRVTTIDNTKINLRADTICLHGDNPRAVEMARAIRQTLTEQKIKIASL